MNQQLFINGQAKFPVSTEALDFIQNQIFLTARMCSLAGQNVIITPATATTDGLVVINGELLPLLAGTAKQYIQIVKTKQSIVAGTQTFIDVRIIRHAQYANSGTPVSQFTTIDNIVRLMLRISAIESNYLTETAIRALVQTVQTNLDVTNDNLNQTRSFLNTAISQHELLAQRVATIENNYRTAAQINELLAANAQHHLPKGSIIDWYGTCRAANIPYGFVPCGMFGKDLTTDAQRNNEKAAWEAKYPNSINIVLTGTDGAYLQINACLGQTVPVLTDRFIVQAGHDYLLGASGGVNSVTLTKEQCALPSHTHPYKADYKGNLSDAESATGAIVRRKEHSSNITNATSMNYAKQDTAAQSHENRPPYFALYKLIKVI